MFIKKCCCFDLKTGVLILACINLVLAPIIQFFNYDPQEDADGFSPNTGMRVFILIMLYILSISMIYGTYKKNLHYLQPFIAIGALINIRDTFFLIKILDYMANADEHQSTEIVFSIIAVSWVVYFWFEWVIVISYYLQLREEAALQAENTNTPA